MSQVSAHLRKLRDSAFGRWKQLNSWVETRVTSNDRTRDDALVHRFKSNAASIEEAPVPISAHAALYGVIMLLIVGCLWAIFGRIDRIVVAPGKLVSDAPSIVLQPFTTSKILAINVRAGDHVRRGQILASFDPTFAAADEASQAQKSHVLNMQVDRLTAELEGASQFRADERDPDGRTQMQIFDQEMSQYRAELSMRDRRIGEIEAQIQANNEIISGLRRQLEIARQVVGIRQNLADQKAGAPLDVMNAQNNEIDLENRLKNATGEANRLIQQKAEIESERQTFRNKWHTEHQQQLVQARQDLVQTLQTLNKAEKMSELTQMSAPVDGVVLEVSDRSAGSVLREAETLVTMVPDGNSLFVEANVSSRDVSYIRVGDTVRIKLEAYPFQRYGTIDGMLDTISPDSVPLKQNDREQLVYLARVRLDGGSTDYIDRGFSLRPGLVASAEIKTGKRSIASYILDPIMRTADESLREP